MAEPNTIIVLADCHIHPGEIDWPPAALTAFSVADLFITLGDMGEAAGLDALAAIAPVVGVRGEDDEPDPRTAPAARVVEAGGLRIGCVFDPEVAGLAACKAPFSWADGAAAVEQSLFGGVVEILLYGSTHRHANTSLDGRALVNPGSVTLPDGQAEGAKGSYARLDAVRGGGFKVTVFEL